jgi:GNAT superfamily N-acetyltransferase
VRVRKYVDGDREQCRALWRELVQTHRQLYDDPTIGGDDPEAGFDRHVDEFGADNVFVADNAGVVGLAGIVWHGKHAELEPIVVASGSRSRGVGRALAEAVISAARARGARRVFVRPTARNKDALAFFHRIGFDGLAYVQLQLDFDDRPRNGRETIAGLTFRT